jgi:hypothetical protein
VYGDDSLLGRQRLPEFRIRVVGPRGWYDRNRPRPTAGILVGLAQPCGFHIYQHRHRAEHGPGGSSVVPKQRRRIVVQSSPAVPRRCERWRANPRNSALAPVRYRSLQSLRVRFRYRKVWGSSACSLRRRRREQVPRRALKRICWVSVPRTHETRKVELARLVVHGNWPLCLRLVELPRPLAHALEQVPDAH